MKRFQLDVQVADHPHAYDMKLRIECDCGNVMIAEHPWVGIGDFTCGRCHKRYVFDLPLEEMTELGVEE